ncbi:MAG: GEVED domain-containing protein, partial [Cruoricaptor ignavus]|nr:GEVED domain-containing protein [Cruoricaptor ignavus]
TVAEDWESAPMNARMLSFRVLVRDNNPNVGQAQISYEDMDIVVGEDGPFSIEKKQLYYTNLDTPLKWNVAKTNEAPYNVSNVMIDYTADNGTTWHTLFTSTPNDGEENVRFPEEFINKEIKIRISAIGNIFYTISEKALVVSTEPCSDKAVENLTIEVKNETAYIDWRTYENAKYVLRYKRKTDSNWTEVETENPNYELSGLLLIDEAMYELQVAQLCSGTRGNFSPSVEFMIPGKNYCTLVSENATLEYISNITVNEMVNNSLGKGYSDFTKDNDKVIYLKKGSTNNRLSITVTYPGEEDYYETLSAWIDFNRDGVMSEEERIVTDFIPDPSNGNVGSVTRNYTFNVPSDAFTGEQSLRMRVALRVGPSINSVPESSCFGTLKFTTDTKNTFRYGEVEDYKVIISED